MKISGVFLYGLTLYLSSTTLAGNEQTQMLSHSHESPPETLIQRDKIGNIENDLDRILSLPNGQIIRIIIKNTHINYFNRNSLYTYLGINKNYIYFKIDNEEDTEIAAKAMRYIKLKKDPQRIYEFKFEN